MKAIKLSEKYKNILSPQTLTIIISDFTKRAKMIESLLCSREFYLKKFGRIIYIGDHNYKGFEFDETNLCQYPTLEMIGMIIKQAEYDNIVNMLFVINFQTTKCSEIIDHLITDRMSKLKGFIGIIIGTDSLDELSEMTIKNSKNIISSESSEQIKKLMKIKEDVLPKKKKEWYLFGEGVYKIIN